MKNITKAIFLLLIVAAGFSSCKKNKKDDPTPETPVNPEGGDSESITRIELHVKDSANTGSVFIVKFYDADGESGKLAPVTDSLKLIAGKTYLVDVFIFDDTKKPVDTIGNEIREEQNYHRFHYKYISTGGSASLSTIITDYDTQVPAQPVGLSYKIKTGVGTGTGSFNLSLRHFANGIPKNDSPSGGEQDISVDFPARIL